MKKDIDILEEKLFRSVQTFFEELNSSNEKSPYGSFKLVVNQLPVCFAKKGDQLWYVVDVSVRVLLQGAASVCSVVCIYLPASTNTKDLKLNTNKSLASATKMNRLLSSIKKDVEDISKKYNWEVSFISTKDAFVEMETFIQTNEETDKILSATFV